MRMYVLQDVDCCVVRCFNTTANGLVNRGDSFKRKNEPLIQSATSAEAGGGGDAIRRSRSRSSSNSQASGAVVATVGDEVAAAVADLDDVPVTQSTSYTVLVLGQPGVGRTALLQQFLTSQFMAAETTPGIFSIVYSLIYIRDDNGSMGHGSRVKWVNKPVWDTWVTGQYW